MHINASGDDVAHIHGIKSSYILTLVIMCPASSMDLAAFFKVAVHRLQFSTKLLNGDDDEKTKGVNYNTYLSAMNISLNFMKVT